MILDSRGIRALCWSWYTRMGVSDLPVGPTVRRVAAYRTAMEMHALAPPEERRFYMTIVDQCQDFLF